MLGVSIFICLLLLSLDIGLGSVRIPPLDVVKVLSGLETENELWNKIREEGRSTALR